MSRVHTLATCLTLLLSFPGSASARPQTHTGLTQQALDVLFQASQDGMGVKQSILNTRLDGPLRGALANGHPYRDIVAAIQAGEGQHYREVIWSSWTPGHVSAVAEQPQLGAVSADPLPFAGFYWASNRGVRINFTTNESRLFDEFAAFGVQVWPQEFHGFYGVTPLASMASYAQSIEKLEASPLATDQVRLRFPCNPTFSPDFMEVQAEKSMPWVEVDVRVGEQAGILRRSIGSAEHGIMDECLATAWTQRADGRRVPSVVEYRYDLSLFQPELEKTFLVFTLEHEISTPALIDGQSIFDLVKTIGFFSGAEQHLASAIGGDRLVQAAVETFRGVRDWSAPVKGAQQQLIESLREVLEQTRNRIAAQGPIWPGTGQEVIDAKLVAPMQPFDLDAKYCSQLGITLLRRLHEHPITFGEILEDHPTDLMAVTEIVASLRGAGLDFAAVRSEDIGDVISDDPFLVLMGEDSASGHLGVALAVDGGKLRIWAAPNENREIPAEALGEFVPLGIYIVPRAWVPAESKGHLLLGSVLAGLAVLLLLGTRRSAKVATTAAAALVTVLCLGCSVEAATEARPALIRASQPEVRAEVELSEERRLTLAVENIAGIPVRIVAATPSCSCIEYCGPEPLTIEAGRAAELPFIIEGTVVGTGEWRVDLVAEAEGGSQLLSVPFTIATKGTMYTVPESLSWSGQAGAAFEAFELRAVVPYGEELGQASCSADFPGVFEVTKTKTGPAHGGSGCSYNVSGTLPDYAPGAYVVNLTFELDRPAGGARQIYAKKVPLILTE